MKCPIFARIDIYLAIRQKNRIEIKKQPLYIEISNAGFACILKIPNKRLRSDAGNEPRDPLKQCWITFVTCTSSLTSLLLLNVVHRIIFGFSTRRNFSTEPKFLLFKFKRFLFSSIWVLVKPIFHSVISPPLAKNFDKEIIFYIHSPLKKFVLLLQLLKIFNFCLTFRWRRERTTNELFRWRNFSPAAARYVSGKRA